MAMALLRVHMGDDDTLRKLGLNSTFKTIPVKEEMETQELHEKLMQRLVKGLNEEQKKNLLDACSHYVITEVNPNDPANMRPLGMDEKAWVFSPKGEKSAYKLFFKHPSELPDLDRLKPKEQPDFEASRSSRQSMRGKRGKVEEKEKASIFGAHLLSICRKSKLDRKWYYPAMIDQTIQYIRENGLQHEGVFRLSASTTSLDEARKEIDDHKPLSLGWNDNVETCCGILKVFMREMEEPLCTWAFYEPMLHIIRLDVPKEKQDVYLMELCHMMPDPNKMIFMKLLALLAEIWPHQEVNKMSPLNLAVTIGPSICKRLKADMMTEMADMADHNAAFQNIVMNGTTITTAKSPDLKHYACAFVKSGCGTKEFPDGSMVLVCRKNKKGEFVMDLEGNGMPTYGEVYGENPATGELSAISTSAIESALDASFQPAPRKYILSSEALVATDSSSTVLNLSESIAAPLSARTESRGSPDPRRSTAGSGSQTARLSSKSSKSKSTDKVQHLKKHISRGTLKLKKKKGKDGSGASIENIFGGSVEDDALRDMEEKERKESAGAADDQKKPADPAQNAESGREGGRIKFDMQHNQRIAMQRRDTSDAPLPAPLSVTREGGKTMKEYQDEIAVLQKVVSTLVADLQYIRKQLKEDSGDRGAAAPPEGSELLVQALQGVETQHGSLSGLEQIYVQRWARSKSLAPLQGGLLHQPDAMALKEAKRRKRSEKRASTIEIKRRKGSGDRKKDGEKKKKKTKDKEDVTSPSRSKRKRVMKVAGEEGDAAVASSPREEDSPASVRSGTAVDDAVAASERASIEVSASESAAASDSEAGADDGRRGVDTGAPEDGSSGETAEVKAEALSETASPESAGADAIEDENDNAADENAVRQASLVEKEEGPAPKEEHSGTEHCSHDEGDASGGCDPELDGIVADYEEELETPAADSGRGEEMGDIVIEDSGAAEEVEEDSGAREGVREDPPAEEDGAEGDGGGEVDSVVVEAEDSGMEEGHQGSVDGSRAEDGNDGVAAEKAKAAGGGQGDGESVGGCEVDNETEEATEESSSEESDE
eukprot:CAMPEP_0119122458 /NCGR_PEP_ID=MMETSP1310-20130426/2707_1 /TAXON_ID=464262 /ORGANISM="Genus nov. species nov., Strain RCC2339" /LENGTH=1056 /DNA_ID=CAMNT_0007112115 /DNA_START=134 /DNA_END=3301 /DNA_ORIENTATION=-